MGDARSEFAGRRAKVHLESTFGGHVGPQKSSGTLARTAGPARPELAGFSRAPVGQAKTSTRLLPVCETIVE